MWIIFPNFIDFSTLHKITENSTEPIIFARYLPSCQTKSDDDCVNEDYSAFIEPISHLKSYVGFSAIYPENLKGAQTY